MAASQTSFHVSEGETFKPKAVQADGHRWLSIKAGENQQVTLFFKSNKDMEDFADEVARVAYAPADG